jgi:hypothetical protein
MRTDQFITSCANGQQTSSKTVASVFFDGKTVYSYGYHYPLLIKVNNFWIVNTRGYSNTTAKHISYAKSHAKFELELPEQTRLESDNKQLTKQLKQITIANIKKYQTELNNLSKRAFKQKQVLDDKIARLNLLKVALS